MEEKVAQQHADFINDLNQFRQNVTADDTMAEAGRKVLLDELIKMLQHEAGSRTGEDIEDVHDMRVAIRRMRSALRLLEPYYKRKAIAPYVSKMRKIARTLGSVRDLDVMIADMQAYAATQSDELRTALEKAIAYLDRRRNAARDKLVTAFDRGAYQRFVGDFAAFLTSPGKGVQKPESDEIQPVQLRHILPEMIYRYLGAVRAYDSVIGEADITTLHALRIEFKRLRYVVSLFGDVLGASASEFIDDLKVIQDHLGKLNDLGVARERLIDLMSEFNPNDDADVQIALQTYIADLEAEQTHLYESFAPVWERFNTKKVQRKLANAVASL